MKWRGFAVGVIAIALVACSHDEGRDDPVSTATIPADAPEGADLLCEFVPSDSAKLTLGTDEFEVSRGKVLREPDGTLQAASCGLMPLGADSTIEMLSVEVEYPLGYAGSVFEDRLADTEQFSRLPESVGIGVYREGRTSSRPGEEIGPVGFAQLSRGSWLITASIRLPADGRDPASDAVALVRQMVETLEIGEEWTLRGDPPTWFDR